MSSLLLVLEKIFDTKIKKVVFVISNCWMILLFASASFFYDQSVFVKNTLSANLAIFGLLAPVFVLMFLVKRKVVKIAVLLGWFYCSAGILFFFEAGFGAFLIGGILPIILWAGYTWVKGAK